MKIEIWSDVVCPFCYIGKRKLEKAIEKLSFKDKVEVEWKSFQLNPDQKTNPSINTLEHLSESKGWSMKQTLEITSNVVNMAAAQGLVFDFEKAVVANTRNAHRLIHLAKESGKGDAMKERLLSAYFSEGKNVDDFATLISLGKEVGLKEENIKAMLETDQFDEAVDQDIYESRQIGVKGVPFFVLDGKFGISGAQPDEVFDQTLEKAWAEFAKSNPIFDMAGNSEGESCDVDGENCL
ncbi:MAG: DsbA family oxidoreductase [Algoriphagus sp.]|uniref:DsbA family oxidoreductase n=1 Tax=Algoriphagus sp. TaxID=1872435 RepID=UPI00271FB5CB|nr:DsbA family oxidoreductase [Algoriphagus sp.]MDO8967791.1 DsbA family oxidoreductase [Algoriphagus sp.]MDP2041961.1 DsbA family oxidoreductase [Algoriphagus sp.]MDP3201242.1 DsbA family oxidoreductase [Algoriphagus sp.]MDP3471059.1 DsbA family oxidoreductase [Algoriphagus sp.]